MGKFICDECGSVYYDYYPVDDICVICGNGHVHLIRSDVRITHIRDVSIDAFVCVCRMED